MEIIADNDVIKISMREVNILWPDDMEREYLRLFKECTKMLSENELEDELLLEVRLNKYINDNASLVLKKWLSYIDDVEHHHVSD